MDAVSSSNDYYALMTAQLRNQDPFAPTDASQTIVESVQFQTLQQLQQLNRSMEALALRTLVTEASSMIGRRIQATLPDGETLSGSVDSVVLHGGAPVLQVGGRAVPLDAVVSIQ